MSRIGKLPVVIPAGVKVSTAGQTVNVEGPKGKLSQSFDSVVEVKVDGKQVIVTPKGDSRFANAMHGTARAIINKMVKGVTEGYSKKLTIEGVGFKAAVKGDIVDLALGYSHPVFVKIPAGIKVVVNEGTKLEVSGADAHAVGQVAAQIYQHKPVEPYKGKGVRLDGQYVRRKEGKKTA